MKVKLFTLMVGFLVMSSSIFAQLSLAPRDFQSQKIKAIQAEQAKKTDKSDKQVEVTPATTKAVGDVTVLVADIDASTGIAANLGCEFDGTNYWFTGRDDANGHGIYQVAPDGTLLNTYLQGTSSTWGMRDMAYDATNNMLYAGDDNGFYSIDPTDGTVTTVFSGQSYGTIRALAFDGTNFWTKSFGDPLYKFSPDGTLLETYTIANSAYGMCYDPGEDCIWLYATGSTENELVQVAMDGTLTGTVIEVAGSLTHGSVGGAFYDFGNVVPGEITIGVLTQGTPDVIWGVEMGVSAAGTAPAAVQNLTATPENTGALTVDLAWDNPALDVDGNALAELTSMDIYSDEDAFTTPIHTIANPTIGASETYTATVTAAGVRSFKLVGSNSDGSGIPAMVSTFVGVDVEVTSHNLLDVVTVGSTVAPEVTVTNNGVGDQTFDVTVEDGDSYSETMSVTALASGDSETVTFADWTPAEGNYTITMTAADPGGDIDLTNNVMTFDVAVVNYIVYETFTTEIPATWTVTGSWVWTDDATNNLDGTPYAFINSDAAGSGNTVVGTLESPEFDASGTKLYILEYDVYYRYINDETADVEVWDGSAWQVVKSYTATEGAWGAPVHEEIDITAYANAAMKVRFNYDDLGGWNWYWAVDNFGVREEEPPAADLAATGAYPNMTSTITEEDVVTPTITIVNIGTDAQNSYEVEVVINDGSADVYTSSKTVTTNIANGESLTIDMDDTWTATAGSFTITATVTLTGDENTDNDTYETTFNASPLNFVLVNIASSQDADNSGTYKLGLAAWETTYTTAKIYGGCNYGDTFYGITDAGVFGSFSADNDVWTEIGATGIAGEAFVISMAIDPATGVPYVLGLSGDYPGFNVNLYAIDRNSGAAVAVGNNAAFGTLLAIAFDENGTLYGIKHNQGGNGEFYSFDKSTFAPTLIGDMGMSVSAYFQSMTFDLSETGDNECYFQAFDDAGGMNGSYDIDITNGTPTQVGSNVLPGQATAIGIPYAVVPPTEYTVTFTVTDGSDAIEGASVEISGQTLTTDASGVATIDLINGTYAYTVSATGYADASGDAIVNGANVDVDVELVGVNELNAANMNIYPNPSNGEFNVEVNGTYEISIMNVAGEVVYTSTVTDKAIINLSNESAGIYFMQLKSDNQVVNHRIMIK